MITLVNNYLLDLTNITRKSGTGAHGEYPAVPEVPFRYSPWVLQQPPSYYRGVCNIMGINLWLNFVFFDQ